MALGSFLSVEQIEKNWKREQASTTVKGTPVSKDVNCKSNQEKYKLDKADFVFSTGIITDTLPFAYAYRVTTRLVGQPVICMAVQPMGGSMLATGTTAYSPGTYVFLAYSQLMGFGLILGSFDRPQGLEEYNIKRNISNVCRTHDEVTDKGILINSSNNNGSFNASQLKYEEHTDIPEWGLSFISGMRWYVNPFMTLMGTNDYTNLTLFECDHLLRLSGINMQQRTSGRENEWLNDEGEYIEYLGSSLYPWEHFGAYYKPGKDVMEKKDKNEWHAEGSIVNYYEPAEKDIRPFHRFMEFGGWLGQGELTQIVLPPAPEPPLHLAKFKKNDDLLASARTHTDMMGNITMRSMGGISITKDGLIPASHRINRPDEFSAKYGDNKDNYNNDSLTLPTYLQSAQTFTTNGITAALGIYDTSGYSKNWRDIFQLAYHTDDYYTPEETSIKGKYDLKSIYAPHYSKLVAETYLEDAESKDVHIDDKRVINYTGNEAGIHILKEGGIVIYDGYGSEIRMINGEITISCAGDLNLRPGKNVNIWGGNDVIIRANDTVDVSTSKKSIRLKAEENVEILGGNNKQGGVIIESKGVGDTYNFDKNGDEIETTGIVLKSADSPIALLGQELYLRCGGDGGTGNGIKIDAGKGKANIDLVAQDINEYINGVHKIDFLKSTSVDKVTYFKESEVKLVGETTITKSMWVDGEIKNAKDIICCGTINSFGNQSGMITPFNLFTREKHNEDIDKHTEPPLKTEPKYMTSVYTTEYTEGKYKEHKIGNDQLINSLSFSFRTDEQLNLGNYLVLEDLWQQIDRESYNEANKWEEKPVQNTVGITYPYPGKKNYQEPIYITQSYVIADFNSSVYTDRSVENHATSPGGPYKAEKYGNQEKVSLNSYKVIK